MTMNDREVVPDGLTAAQHQAQRGVLHGSEIVMNVRTANIPRVDDEDRVGIERLSDDFSRVQLTFGYMGYAEHPPGACPGPSPGSQVRYHVNVLLRRPPLDQARRQIVHAGLAGYHVPLPGPPRHQRQRLLQHPRRSRRRTRHGGQCYQPERIICCLIARPRCWSWTTSRRSSASSRARWRCRAGPRSRPWTASAMRAGATTGRS